MEKKTKRPKQAFIIKSIRMRSRWNPLRYVAGRFKVEAQQIPLSSITCNCPQCMARREAARRYEEARWKAATPKGYVQ